MPHPSDKLLLIVLNEIESVSRLGLYGIPQLGKFRLEQFGEEEVPPCHLRWELLATSIHLRDKPTTWGGFFGPLSSGTNDDGSSWESPPLSAITPACIDHWQQRMLSCRHPILRAHFADLVWELYSQAKEQRSPIKSVQTAIDSYLEAVVNDRIEPTGRQDRIVSRMLYLCATIGDDARLTNVCTELLKHAESNETEEAIVTTTRDLFPRFLEINKRKRPVALLDHMAQRLRGQLEAFTPEFGKQWGHEAIALPLAEYYGQVGKREEALKVLKLYGEAVEWEAQQAKSILAVGWLERVYKLYKKNEMHEDAQRILKLVESRQPEIPNELVPMRVPYTIPHHELEELRDSLVKESIEQSILNIVRCFHPRVAIVREEIEELNQQFPLQKYFNASLVDHAGRTVARIEDDDDKLVHRLVQDLDFADVFIQIVLSGLVSRFELTADSILDEITTSPVWSEERLPVLKRGIQAFLAGDTLVAAHLLIPEIESAIRNLADDVGVLLQKPHRNGAYVLKNLDELLREDAVIKVLSNDTCIYFRALFTDQRGWNLRNKICHGLSTASSLSEKVVRRLMLVIFLLGLLRKQGQDSTHETEVDSAGKAGQGPESP